MSNQEEKLTTRELLSSIINVLDVDNKPEMMQAIANIPDTQLQGLEALKAHMSRLIDKNTAPHLPDVVEAVRAPLERDFVNTQISAISDRGFTEQELETIRSLSGVDRFRKAMEIQESNLRTKFSATASDREKQLEAELKAQKESYENTIKQKDLERKAQEELREREQREKVVDGFVQSLPISESFLSEAQSRVAMAKALITDAITKEGGMIVVVNGEPILRNKNNPAMHLTDGQRVVTLKELAVRVLAKNNILAEKKKTDPYPPQPRALPGPAPTPEPEVNLLAQRRQSRYLRSFIPG